MPGSSGSISSTRSTCCFSVIPGASNPDYIKENIQIFDFALTDEEMQQMRSLNKEKRFFNATLEDVEKMVWGARL